MKTALNFSRFALACLLISTLGAATLWAQSPRGEVGPPAPPPIPQPAPPAPLPLKSVEDKTAPAGWMRYEVGGATAARFSFILPAAPEVSGERIKMPTGEMIAVRYYMTAGAAGFYGANYLDDMPVASGSWTVTQKQNFFDNFAKGFAEGFQAGISKQGLTDQIKLLERRTAKGGGLAGYEQDVSFGLYSGRLRLVFSGRRAYALVSLWNGNGAESERNAFFEALRVNLKP